MDLSSNMLVENTFMQNFLWFKVDFVYEDLCGRPFVQNFVDNLLV